jgi:hypothetical protein
MKPHHTTSSARNADLRFILQALLAVSVVVSFVLFFHVT